MYCLKCGNLLKKEDNFCSICGTPNSAEAKRMSQGISGYGPVRDDEPINLDDFFKADERTERTFAKMDRELEEIKARATENLLRRKTGDASARRAARLAKKAAAGADRRDRQSYEMNADLDFNDDVFQKNIEREALVGRRGQLKNEKTMYQQERDNSGPERLFEAEPAGQAVLLEESKDYTQKPSKTKRHHLFREDTVEIPNIFDEIAESMEKNRQQGKGYGTLTPKEADDDMPLTWQTSDTDISGRIPAGFVPTAGDIEGVFPLPPKPRTGDDAQPEPASAITAPQSADEANSPDNPDVPAEEFGHIRSWDIEGEQQEQEKAPYALRRPSRAQTADIFKSAEEPEYEYFRYRSKKKKGPNPVLIAVAVLIIIIAAVGTKMLYDGETPASVFHQLQDVFAANSDITSGEGAQTIQDGGDAGEQNMETYSAEQTPPSISELKEQGVSDPAKMILYVLSKGINKNIKTVEYNPDLKYVAGTKYKSDDITSAKPITENLFYEKNGEKYYYTESIISTMIQYNSQWVDYFNSQDKSVLELIAKGSKAYQDVIAFSSDGAREECALLEIGEMRKGKDGYYVWTKEVYNVTKGTASKSEESQWIYYLEPSGENMKIVNYYYY